MLLLLKAADETLFGTLDVLSEENYPCGPFKPERSSSLSVMRQDWSPCLTMCGCSLTGVPQLGRTTLLHDTAGPTFSAEEMIAMRKQADEEEQQVQLSLLLF